MNELHDWLSRQHHGLCTFQLFRGKAAHLGEKEPYKKALYVLLSRLADRYIEAFDEKPVPVKVADRAYQRLLTLLASLDQSASAEGRLAELNRVAGVDLFAPNQNLEGYNGAVEAKSRVVVGT